MGLAVCSTSDCHTTKTEQSTHGVDAVLGAERHGDAACVPALVDPPKLRPTQPEPGLNRPMWTELFFDLVFVVAVGRTTDLLHEDPSPIGALWFGFMFVVLVWTWSNFVLYTERFETDDVVHRLAKAVAMFAVAAGALLVPTVREGGADDFVVAYLAVRLVLIGLYQRAWRHVPEVHGALRISLSRSSPCSSASRCCTGSGRSFLVDRRRERAPRSSGRRIAS